MKTIYNIFYALLLGSFIIGMISCDDFLEEDPKGRLAEETFFTNESDLNASVNALYKVIADAQHGNHVCGTNNLGIKAQLSPEKRQ